ncbi:LOW QUALITY PROTEIN: hypothetical protein TorRG33x02_265730 [Trema orientale]|uniref:Uncharacterized protein n=1 Tax=Trema orientale TaxID=63057 RepID=A0A2P5D1U4_TREOI|nr:LOW QUALITY PROTEIN: hypothetical protein TorRG33x02_265730 [Trema orientale]
MGDSTTHNSAQKNCCPLSAGLKPFRFLQVTTMYIDEKLCVTPIFNRNKAL